MPSETPVLPTQPEKAHHYTYLKEFRTQQCPLFLQHKCTQHRPYTCFHWHFLNQRRRRPIRKRDGTFNYSADIYCTKYDETTGICEDGDDCPFLHRTAGDTERRYHLRYYKTGNCVHETDAKQHCVKNGPHCAFAHGIHDLRQPVYDIRELQGNAEKGQGALDGSATTQLEKDRLVNEDPRWNDTNYVLANYKTDTCKRPPRLCRQGYACPSYHNSRDRRRSPKEYKYRSTPCPNVKHGDEWEDPSQCENGDSCAYCHTRTEQQFHPEIYKSTKCKDMVQTGYCPRGPFCAFAHVEQEMTTQRELSSSLNDNSLAAFLTNALSPSKASDISQAESKENDMKLKENGDFGQPPKDYSSSNGTLHGPLSSRDNVNASLPQPIGNGRSGSFSHSLPSNESQSNHMRAPGSEREDQAKLRQQLAAIDDDPSLDMTERLRRRQNLVLLHNLTISSPLATLLTAGVTSSTIGTIGTPPQGITMPPSSSNPTTPSSTSTMSPHAPVFYPPGETVESVIGNALDDDFGELSLASIDREFREKDNDANSVCSSYSAGFPSNYFGPSSLPVTIPSSVPRTQLTSLSSQSPPVNSPLAGNFIAPHLQHQQQHKQEQQLHGAAAAFLSQPNPGKFSAPGFGDFNMSPSQTNSNNNGISHSPLMAGSYGSSGGAISNGFNGFASASETVRLRDELSTNKAKMVQWEEGITQARNACEAWKKEAEEAHKKAKMAEEERGQILKQREEALNQVVKLKTEMDQLKGGPFLHCLQRINDLDNVPIPMLNQIQNQLRQDLEIVDKLIIQQASVKCLVCYERGRSVTVMPCNHYVLCDICATKQTTCPFCKSQISQASNHMRPL